MRGKYRKYIQNLSSVVPCQAWSVCKSGEAVLTEMVQKGISKNLEANLETNVKKTWQIRRKTLKIMVICLFQEEGTLILLIQMTSVSY